VLVGSITFYDFCSFRCAILAVNMCINYSFFYIYDVNKSLLMSVH